MLYLSQLLNNASIDGKTIFAPDSHSTLSGIGPVLMAIVNIPAATAT